MERILWVVLGGLAFVAALRARRSKRSQRVGRVALGVLYCAAGVVHAVYLSTGDDYWDVAHDAHPAILRDVWAAVVVPYHDVLISLLIVFEAAVGHLILRGGRATRAGLWAALAMHVLLLPFGWVLGLWSLFMLIAIALLLRAEYRDAHGASLGAPDDTLSCGSTAHARTPAAGLANARPRRGTRRAGEGTG